MRRLFRKIIGCVELCLKPIFVFYIRLFESHVNQAWGRASLAFVKNAPASAKFNGRVFVGYPERLELGEHVRVGRGCYFHCQSGLKIGLNAQISRNVVIYTASHDYEGDAVPYDDSYVARPVTIGCHVWIGMNVCILPGVTIGDGAVIGMGTVISKDVPKGAVVVGGGQRVVKTREMEKFVQLAENYEWFGRKWPNL